MANQFFVTNWNGADFGSDVEDRYGRPRVITRGFQRLSDMNKISTKIVRFLEENAKDGDSVILIGNGILNIIAVHWFLNNFGRCRIIFNNAETKRFEDVELVNTSFSLPPTIPSAE